MTNPINTPVRIRYNLKFGVSKLKVGDLIEVLFIPNNRASFELGKKYLVIRMSECYGGCLYCGTGKIKIAVNTASTYTCGCVVKNITTKENLNSLINYHPLGKAIAKINFVFRQGVVVGRES